VAMLLDWLGQKRGLRHFEHAAAAMDIAVDAILKDPASRTSDIGGALGCKAFGERVASSIQADRAHH
jgi:3-isopropylmalate dehydrogenase